MKRLTVLLLCLLLCTACGAKPHQELVEPAVEFLKMAWVDVYAQNREFIDADGYLEIRDARIVYLNEELPAELHGQDIGNVLAQRYEDVACVIEFTILTDYYGVGPEYYVHPPMYTDVVVKKDGTMRRATDYVRGFGQTFFTYDYSGLVSHVVELGDAYNGKWYLKY